MGFKKNDQTHPAPPSNSPTFPVILKVFSKAAYLLQDANEHNHEESLKEIEDLRKYCPSPILFIYQAGMANMCASMATDVHAIQRYRQMAIDCAQQSVRLSNNSIECTFYLAYFLKNLSYDADGLNKAIELCNKGLAIEDQSSITYSINPFATRNWNGEFHMLKAQCFGKLRELKPESQKHLRSVSGTENRKDQHPVRIDQCKLHFTGLTLQSASSSDQSLCFGNQEPQLDQEYLQKRKAIDEEPVGKVTKLAKLKSVATPDSLKNTQEMSVKYLNIAGENALITRLIKSLPTGPGPQVIQTAGASTQEEQSRLLLAIDVHKSSREVPSLFLEHVRQDLQMMNNNSKAMERHNDVELRMMFDLLFPRESSS